MIKKILRYQIWHLAALAALVAIVRSAFLYFYREGAGGLWNIETNIWFAIAVAVPIIHQVYVLIIWRLELYLSTFSSRFGIQKSFKLFSKGFSLLFAGRMVSIVLLAISDMHTLVITPVYVYILSALIIPVVIYLFYSVLRYFTMERAYGIDHFDKEFSKPYVKGGIFRFTGNGMYIYGFLILYLPGLLLFSRAALLVALFNHLYIWVHYFVTEKPDMQYIYGKKNSD